jgi:hypothetical protein
MATRKIPEPTPEQIELIMIRLLGAAGSSTGQQALFRIGKRAGFFWTHRGCPYPKSVNMLTDERCVHCGADRPAGKRPS